MGNVIVGLKSRFRCLLAVNFHIVHIFVHLALYLRWARNIRALNHNGTELLSAQQFDHAKMSFIGIDAQLDNLAERKYYV